MVPQQKQPRVRRRFLLGSLLVLVVAAAFVGTHRLAIYDWIRLHNYTPPATIATMASDDDMTPYARHVFYVNQPQLESRTMFAPHCPSGTEQTVVLGCYQSNQAGIYLLQVTNNELAGIEQVTAAHETLHAVYDRLSSSERNKVDAMLESYYETGLTDQTIKDTIAAYKKSEPDDVVNEMHSVFGTEVANLPAPLETYYKQYFTDRSKVTGYYAEYEQAFTSRQAAIKQDDDQLASWKTQIASMESDVSAKLTALNGQRATLNAERSSGSTDAYNAGVQGFNQSVNAYNSEVDQLHALITNYNQLVVTRNGIALEEQQLVQSITSSTATTQ